MQLLSKISRPLGLRVVEFQASEWGSLSKICAQQTRTCEQPSVHCPGIRRGCQGIQRLLIQSEAPHVLGSGVEEAAHDNKACGAYTVRGCEV